MKILVPVKRVVDPNVKIRIKDDKSGIVLENVKMSMNPFDENAVEEAVRIKEAGKADEIVAVSIGVQQVQETLRTALAMGADRAIMIKTESTLEPLQIAKLLKAISLKENPDLIIMGKQSTDEEKSSVGQMLSALLKWSQVTFVSKLEIDGTKIIATREIDGGRQRIALSMPAILTADLSLNEPRYSNLANIMKAKKKPLEEITPEALCVDIVQHLEILKIVEPPARKSGIKINSIEELVEKLKNEAKVL